MNPLLVVCILNILAGISSAPPPEDLASLNCKIHELETIARILTDRRHHNYNYSTYSHEPLAHVPNISINVSKSIQFTHNLEFLHSQLSGVKSTIFFLRNNLYHAEIFKEHTLIYPARGGEEVLTLQASILFISLVKATIDYEICYLDRELGISCALYQGNVTTLDFKRTQLGWNGSDVDTQEIQYYHVQKHDSLHLHSLLLKNGEMRIYNGAGELRAVTQSSSAKVVKYIDHNPYPMIVGKDKISFLEPFRASQSSLGCPVVDNSVIDAEVETPFSNTFYLATQDELLVMSYSLKKTQKQCKISNRIPITFATGSLLKMMYPTLLLNDSFINLTDTLTPSQTPLPVPVCQSNLFEAEYRNNEQYLLHRCCNQSNCTSNLYVRSKKTQSVPKHYKYAIFLVIFIVVGLKVWNSRGKAEAEADFSDNPHLDDPMVRYANNISKAKKKKPKE